MDTSYFFPPLFFVTLLFWYFLAIIGLRVYANVGM